MSTAMATEHWNSLGWHATHACSMNSKLRGKATAVHQLHARYTAPAACTHGVHEELSFHSTAVIPV